MALEWTGEPISGRGVRERPFQVENDGRSVPGLVWTPEQCEGGRPLVLLGHGGSAHKREAYILSLARRLVRHHGVAAAAIDGPTHGDRSLPGQSDVASVRREFRLAWARPETTDQMIEDWRSTLDALQKLEEIGIGAVGYWGLSMGTIFGLPFVAAEPRVVAAVLGLMGTIGPTGERLRSDAARISCPILFLQQWDDQLVPRDALCELFGALGSTDKRLHAHPGAHEAVPVEEFSHAETFLAKHLGIRDQA